MRTRLLVKAETDISGDAFEALVERLNAYLEAEKLEEIVIATTDTSDPLELWMQNPAAVGLP